MEQQKELLDKSLGKKELLCGCVHDFLIQSFGQAEALLCT